MVKWSIRLRRTVAGVVALCAAALAVSPSGARAFPALPGTFTQVAAGGGEACAVRTSGEVVCWDEVGHIFLAPPGTYRQVSLSTGSVSPDLDRACAVRTDQTLACFGPPFADSTPAGTFRAVDVGNEQACALRTDQTLVCWGSPQIGEPDLVPPAGAFTAVAVADGEFPLACALSSAQTIACWGGGANLPAAVPPAGTFTAFDFSANGGCAVRTDGTVVCWGSDGSGDTLAPAGPFLSVSKRINQSCGVRADHTVSCWGSNFNERGTPPPGTFTQVTIGLGFGCGVRTDQTLACWPDTTAAARAALPAPFGANGVFSLPSNRTCVSRRHFRIRIRRQRAGVTLISAAVAVNGRRVAVRKGRRLTAPVDLRGLPKGRFTVRISALTSDARAIVGTRRYRTCTPKRAGSGNGPLVLAAASVGRGGAMRRISALTSDLPGEGH